MNVTSKAHEAAGRWLERMGVGEAITRKELDWSNFDAMDAQVKQDGRITRDELALSIQQLSPSSRKILDHALGKEDTGALERAMNVLSLGFLGWMEKVDWRDQMKEYFSSSVSLKN